jgi:hypothetical protein
MYEPGGGLWNEGSRYNCRLNRIFAFREIDPYCGRE